MHLLPSVKKITHQSAVYQLSDSTLISFQGTAAGVGILPAQQLAEELTNYAAISPAIVRSLTTDTAAIRLSIDAPMTDMYRIVIDASGICVCGQDESGLFYACQTLRQIIRQHGRALPQLTITDSPDFAHRGFYYDITRGKVPTFDSLCTLVKKLSFYKVNELQLYVEHTFAFQKHKNISAGKSPITAEEIMALDALCQQYHIDLIPSLTTFGHCYEILRCKRLEHLNELNVKGSEHTYSWWDRQAHFTLDALNAESFALVEDMLDEYMPLFSSQHFNICCDETLDLTRGRNIGTKKEDGSLHTAASLYLDFTKKIIAAVRARGRKPQMWGDILQEHPEVIDEIPKDCTILNWSYDPALTNGSCEPFVQAGLPFYVCPGTSSWNHFFPDIETAAQNIRNFASEGKKHGAVGLLNTDWGDYGHPGLIGGSLHGIILGASCAWDAEGNDAATFDAAFSCLELGSNGTHNPAAMLRAFSDARVFDMTPLAMQFDPMTSMLEAPQEGRRRRAARFDAEELTASEDYADSAKKMRQHRDAFIQSMSASGTLSDASVQDMVCGMWGEILIYESSYLIQCGKGTLEYSKATAAGLGYYTTADEIRSFEAVYTERWHAWSKPAEYSRLRDFLLQIADLLDSYGIARTH